MDYRIISAGFCSVARRDQARATGVCVCFVCDCHVLLQHPGTNCHEQIPSSASCGFSIFTAFPYSVSTRKGLQKLQEPSSDELCIINLERAKRFCNAPDTAKSEPYRSLTCHRHVQAEHTVGTNQLNKLIIRASLAYHILMAYATSCVHELFRKRLTQN